MNTCDIIIPTYNGKEKLRLTIPALLEQDIPPGWMVRIIISDDGSEEPVERFLSEYIWKAPWSYPVVLQHPRVGRSQARNIAIDAATADILLFLADDIIVRPHGLREHLLFHEIHTNPTAAALGCVVWDPRIHPTPFMDWMMHGGQQNDYDSILGASVCNAAHSFYGSFVSVKRTFLGSDRFTDAFTLYGWEDLELGARLQERGIVLHVLENAKALHRHRYTADDILRRQRVVGVSKYLVNTNSIRRVRHALYGVSGARGLMRYLLKNWGDTINTPRIFARATAGEFWYGVHHTNRLLKSGLE